MASRLYPLLTSVRLPIHDMGLMAAAKLIATTTERRTHTNEKTEVVPTLVVRVIDGRTAEDLTASIGASAVRRRTRPGTARNTEGRAEQLALQGRCLQVGR